MTAATTRTSCPPSSGPQGNPGNPPGLPSIFRLNRACSDAAIRHLIQLQRFAARTSKKSGSPSWRTRLPPALRAQQFLQAARPVRISSMKNTMPPSTWTPTARLPGEENPRYHQNECMEDRGYVVIRFGHKDDWVTILKNIRTSSERKMTFAVGSLVRRGAASGSSLPQSDSDLLMLRPLGGSEEEVTGIYVPLESVEHARFALPDPAVWVISDPAVYSATPSGLVSGRAPAPFARSLTWQSSQGLPLVPLLMALKLDPIRILIADDVGIGKTVEAALIARELLDRGEVTRLAVLCRLNWQSNGNESFATSSTSTRHWFFPAPLQAGAWPAVGRVLFEHHPCHRLP